MSGISRLEALEIFSNPTDLEIIITEDKKSKKYGIAFCRGPGHNFKLMLSADPYTEEFKDVINAARTILEGIYQAMTEELKNPESLIVQFLNPENNQLDESKSLNPELIDRIIKELKEHRIASTYKMTTPA